MYRTCFLLAIIGQNFIGGLSHVFTYSNSFSNSKSGIAGSPACSIDVDNSLTKINQPVLIQFDGNDFSLPSPVKKGQKSVINFSENSEIIVACPGAGNQLSITQQDTVLATCNFKNQLQSKDGNHKIIGTDKFFCKKPVTPKIEKIGEKCGENLQWDTYRIGFSVDSMNKWVTMYTVCHDAENMNTLYSTNTIEGKTLKARQKNVPRPSGFLAGNLEELYGGGSPNDYYLKQTQVENFRKLFEPENTKKYFDVYYRFLSRGHLTPDADMALSPWKVSSYMYINVAPQWQMINAGNWLRIENLVRNAAIRAEDDLTIVTGTFGVLKLEIGKQAHELYLAPSNKLRVPEQFWKIVYNERTRSAIVIVTSNNPYAEVKHLCTDVCKTYGWWHENFQDEKNLRRGLTYCCTYADFIKQVTYAPALAVEKTYVMPTPPPPPPPSRLYTAAKKVIANKMRWKEKEKEEKEKRERKLKKEKKD